MYKNQQRGVTLIEILVTIAIMTLIFTLTTRVFSDFRARKNLDAATEKVLAAFSKAYFDTVGSRGDTQYGVHLDSDGVTVFSGSSYNQAASSNVQYSLDNFTEITATSTADGGSEVIFSRVYGTTSQSGSFVIRSKQNQALRNTIKISSTGVVSVQ